MSFIKASALGPLTGLGASSNTATIVDPATPASGSAYLGPLVGFAPITASSQTSIEFIGIPSWARRVTMGIYQISSNSTGFHQIQLGTSGGYATSGYYGQFGGSFNISTGFKLNTGGASSTFVTVATWICVSAVTNTWAMQVVIGDTTGGTGVYYFAGSIALSGTLDRKSVV